MIEYLYCITAVAYYRQRLIKERAVLLESTFIQCVIVSERKRGRKEEK